MNDLPPSKPAALAGFLRLLGRLEKSVCVAAFAVLALLLFTDVLLREISGNGIAWAHQAGLYANLLVTVFGMGIAGGAGSHLRPRFADHWLPASWEPALQRLSWLVTALVLLAFALLALSLVLETRLLAEMATVLRIPLWPVQALIPLGFALTASRYLCYALQPSLAPAES